MRLSRILRTGGLLPPGETEGIYGPWRVGLGYRYSWGGTVLRWGNWKRRSSQSETTLDNERQEKRTQSLTEGLVGMGKWDISAGKGQEVCIA